MEKTSRVQWLDTMKGFLALVVCIGHALPFAGTGEIIPFKEIYFLISSFHMPAFFVVSGLLVKSPYTDAPWRDYMGGALRKTVNLIIPTILIIGLPAPIYLYAGWPLPSIWFPVVMSAVVWVYPPMLMLLREKGTVLATLFALTICGRFLHPALSMLFGYCTCYAIGAVLTEKLPEKSTRWTFAASVVGFIVIQIVVWVSYRMLGMDIVTDSLWKTCVGSCTTIILLCWFRWYSRSGILTRAGNYSFIIYLSHVILGKWMSVYTPVFSIAWRTMLVILLSILFFLLPYWMCVCLGHTAVGRLLLSPYSCLRQHMSKR